ncbi:hypothetical protein KKB10_03025 [Patescibacteria group bacterium]|nr:hypothetical protein [Patescibacteria group bacterium]
MKIYNEFCLNSVLSFRDDEEIMNFVDNCCIDNNKPSLIYQQKEKSMPKILHFEDDTFLSGMYKKKFKQARALYGEFSPALI